MEPGADTLPRAGLMMQLSQQLLCYRRLMNQVMGGPLLDSILSSKSCGLLLLETTIIDHPSHSSQC